MPEHPLKTYKTKSQNAGGNCQGSLRLSGGFEHRNILEVLPYMAKCLGKDDSFSPMEESHESQEFKAS